jgi:UDP-N-acetylglucosamine 1-carboxyvinyltransferase
MGLNCSYDDDRLVVRQSKLTAVRRITTGLWPGFPSDLVSLVTVLSTQAEGRTLVHDWLYELRLFALEQMSAMRADLFLCDPHRIIVSGPTRLRGRILDSRDLRSGMALIAAALAAEGESRVTPLETVERGYASLVERLRDLRRAGRARGLTQIPPPGFFGASGACDIGNAVPGSVPTSG